MVKPLSRQLKCLGEYAGTTIMGDGTVALILDVMGLAVAAGLAGESREQAHGALAKDDARDGLQTQTLLCGGSGGLAPLCLPTSMVARLEKVATSSIEYANGRQVIQYRGDILPIIRLSEVFGAPTRDASQAGNCRSSFMPSKIIIAASL